VKTLPTFYKGLGLSETQKAQILETMGKFQFKIDKLTKGPATLKEDKKKAVEAFLPDHRKKLYRLLKSGKTADREKAK
jgi:hypothetical protein